MSHELRTQLNSLLILSRMLAENPAGNLEDQQIEFAQTIHAAGNDLLALINDILDIAKVEAGKMDLHLGQLALVDLCDDVDRAFRPVAEEKGLRFAIERDPALPAAIVTDEQRLEQILRNLLSNAVKFTHDGSVTLRISAAEGDALAFSVIDTGVGIPDEKLALIFEAFQQADGTTSRKYGGTGLGLSISREIARLLGGEIRVRSTMGEGSTFTLLLPATFEPPAPILEPEGGEDVPQPQSPPLDDSSNGAGNGAGAAVNAPLPAMVAAAAEDAAEPGHGISPHPEVADDRARIAPGDRVVLLVSDTIEECELAMGHAREHGLKAVVALGGAGSLTLAQEHPLDGVVLLGGVGLLGQLKHHPRTRHLPVWLVDDDDTARRSVAELVGGQDVEVVAVGTAAEATEQLDNATFDCLVLDLKL